MSQKIRILLCDDQRLFREGLRTILETESDFEVAGEAANGEEAVALAQQLAPDLVLLDVRMPRMDGVEATRRIRAAGDRQVVILSTYDDDEFILEALKAGAAGYLLKDFPSEELIKALRTIHHGGGVLIPRRLPRRSQRRSAGTGLRGPAPPSWSRSLGVKMRSSG